jgi:hypothetical protein
MFFTDLTNVWRKQESLQDQIAYFGVLRLTKGYVTTLFCPIGQAYHPQSIIQKQCEKRK